MKDESVIKYGFLVWILFIPVIWSKYCSVVKSRNEKYTTSCWLVFRCTKYRTVTYRTKVCCDGWTGSGCVEAICRGRSDAEACNKYFPNSHIILADKTIVKKSIGKCIRPDVCECKQDGFYSAGPYCDICSPINNCNLEYCTTKTNQKCRRCEGVVEPSIGKQAYIISSNKKECQKACSWRSDSSRCYPGSCYLGLYSKCRCSEGFTGKHCHKITAHPSILYNQLTLTADNGETVDAPSDFGGSSPQPITWTNIMKPKELFYSLKSNYAQPNPNRAPFVVDYKVGIIGGQILFSKRNKYGVESQFQEHQCATIYNRYNPNQSVFDCSKTIRPTISLPFLHLERLSFNITTNIGGFVTITDFERNVKNTYYYIPNSLSRVFEIRFDNVSPHHCQPVNNCKQIMLTDVDITNKAENTVYWDGWIDTDSGIGVYEIEIFSMKPVGNELMIDKRTFDTNTILKSQKLKFTHPDVYSVVIAVQDKAGNIKIARRCLIFDDENRVSTRTKTYLRVTSALPSTNYTWQQNHGPVDIDWENRYINTKHHNGKYLAGIQDYHGVDTEYDDHYGKRTTRPIDNVQGIVRYETYYGIDGQGGSTIQPTDDDFTSTGNLNQFVTIPPTLQDGDTLKYYIRAYDITEFYLEESITVYFDMSPPEIELNVTVHEVAGFYHLVLDWTAYDLHSGLDTVEWEFYDNFTGDVLVHDPQPIPSQGKLQTLSECEEKYSRGSDCYCTLLAGCYYRHFHVKAGISVHKNAIRDNGYYIQVNVINNAQLNTTLIYKIP